MPSNRPMSTHIDPPNQGGHMLDQSLQDVLDILRKDEDTMLALGTAYYEDDREPADAYDWEDENDEGN